ncbi:stress response translation initiation inhibitor YciH [Oryzomonas sagensis]|uniref:Stress response translation initiation inhibitor YciH n=1 Tax=Oryzomonas sagensis TaxID=2603857 RepID=A0ABQ6TLI6_9BACT|nr:stress response translation initiation inhibitor YciH [Oryzomonas sagensis]KAB0668805.1 stress response translation initiation inhibitor YciH [Oryzomonas sagensis]
MKRGEETTLVYSSETGRVSRGAAKPQGMQPSKRVPAQPPADGTVRLRREVKGRGGGTVIVITGVPLTGEALKELAGALKKRCGCGGTVKEGVIEIQGDHRDTLLKELESRGYRVKLAGG